jgi:hypothetical protein
MLGLENRKRTNDGELRWKGCRYPLRIKKKVPLSRHLAAGKLAGNFHPQVPNALSHLKKVLAGEYSPGHQIFIIFQDKIALSLSCFESRNRLVLARAL